MPLVSLERRTASSTGSTRQRKHQEAVLIGSSAVCTRYRSTVGGTALRGRSA